MKKYVFLLLSIVWLLPLAAQEQPDLSEQEGLKVVSFELMQNDISARTKQVLDINDVPCALVKIQVLTEDKISFKGMLIGDIQMYLNEYWAYMAEGSKKITVSHPLYEALDVVFSDVSNGEIKKLEKLTTYKLVISVPEKAVDTVVVAETFEAKLEEARAMYAKAGEHADSEYFRKVVGLYEAAMKHTDCPQDMLQPLQTEFDDMRFMRKYTYAYEKLNRLAAEKEQTYGYESDSVYRYLKLAYNATLKLTRKYPQLASFRQMAKTAETALGNHPLGQVTKQGTVTKERLSAYGMVKIDKCVLPLSAITIYACTKDKPTKKDAMVAIGRVKADGTFSVVLPDGYTYILFEDEKKAHLILEPNTELNIIL